MISRNAGLGHIIDQKSAKQLKFQRDTNCYSIKQIKTKNYINFFYFGARIMYSVLCLPKGWRVDSGRYKRFVFSKPPDLFWDPSGLLFNGHHGLFPRRYSIRGMQLNSDRLIAPKLRNREGIASLMLMSSCLAEGKLSSNPINVLNAVFSTNIYIYIYTHETLQNLQLHLIISSSTPISF